MGWVDGPCRPERDDWGVRPALETGLSCVLGPWRPFFVAKGKVSTGDAFAHREPGLLFHSQVMIGKKTHRHFTLFCTTKIYKEVE